VTVYRGLHQCCCPLVWAEMLPDNFDGTRVSKDAITAAQAWALTLTG